VSFQLDYDEDEDILTATWNPPRNAITQEARAGLFLRVDPETYQPIGFETLDIKSRPELRELITELFPDTVLAIKAGTATSSLPRGDLEERLRRLVPDDWPSSWETAVYAAADETSSDVP
jgi:hypothetical protein